MKGSIQTETPPSFGAPIPITETLLHIYCRVMTPMNPPPYSPLSKGRTMNTICITALIIAVALIPVFTAQGQGPRHHNDYRASPSHRVETLNLRAKGLRPNAVFTVFLSGSTSYIGELETNDEGRAALRVGSFPNAGQNLKHTVLRLSNPVVDDVCFTPAHVGEIASGRTPSIATILTGESVPMDDNAFLFHTIHWRFIKCATTF